MNQAWQYKEALITTTSEVQYSVEDYCIVDIGSRLVVIAKFKDNSYSRSVFIPWDRILSIETDEDFELVKYGEELDSE